ncbi:MAG: hypothetical protein LBQ54_05745 [Planctomycetaceae bacterium]|nr:hypothetical protein [Planctomycetaceae bacterium]
MRSASVEKSFQLEAEGNYGEATCFPVPVGRWYQPAEQKESGWKRYLLKATASKRPGANRPSRLETEWNAVTMRLLRWNSMFPRSRCSLESIGGTKRKWLETLFIESDRLEEAGSKPPAAASRLRCSSMFPL